MFIFQIVIKQYLQNVLPISICLTYLKNIIFEKNIIFLIDKKH